jgi:hypothetical protein
MRDGQAGPRLAPRIAERKVAVGLDTAGLGQPADLSQ